MGKITLSVTERANQPPINTGWNSIDLSSGAVHVLTSANFTIETNPPYLDPEGDPFNGIKVTRLPAKGTIALAGSPAGLNANYSKAQIDSGSFTYTSDASDDEGYTDGLFEFLVTDTVSGEYSTARGSIIFNVATSLNLSPTEVGDGEADITLGHVFTFTEASLTSSLNPPYSDPEGNPPYRLLIVTLPLFGSLELNGVAVSADQEIEWTDVTAGNLKYTSESLPLGEVEGFEFMISDTGSQQYIG